MFSIRAFPLLFMTAFLWLVPQAHASSCGNGVLNQGEQCDDANTSPTDGCAPNCTIYRGWTCTGSPSVCTPLPTTACGNGIVNVGEQCDDGNVTSGDGCQSNCAVQSGWECIGSPSSCAPSQPSVDCGNGIVDTGEQCDDGNLTSGDGCQSDCTVQSGWECAGSPSSCAPSEPTVDCGNGIVESGEQCDGGACCFECSFVTGGTTCRAAVSPSCDVAETCSGTSASCPADVLVGCTDDDDLACTVPTCNISGQCTVTDLCNGICREPNFWARRTSGGKNGKSLIESILDDVGSISVCGETIDTATTTGDLDSALEALCVRTQGVEQRELYRELVATALNCAVSGGGTCDEILSPFVDVGFTECSNRCAGAPAPGSPSIDECIDQLSCFNRGGRSIDGECALGTCEANPSELCGADFGSCTGGIATAAVAARGARGLGNSTSHGKNQGINGDDVDEVDEEQCEPFEDSCAEARLCSTNTGAQAQICPARTRPSGQKLCQQARKNQCTIDDCN